MINEKQQLIYNIFLKYSRRGKPFTFRKNFNNISDDVVYYLTKLETFFNCFKDIKYDDYFEAPYKILDDKGYYDLKFYLTQKAKKCYANYMQNKRINQKISKDNISKNLTFIVKFCKDKNINFKDYLDYKENNTQTFPDFIKHIKNGDIDMFILFGFDDVDYKLNFNNDISLYINDFDNLISQSRIIFYSSEYKDFIKTAIKKITEQWH